MSALLVIYGCGGHARSLANTAIKNAFDKILFIDPNARANESILHFPVLSALTADYLKERRYEIIGLGNNSARAALYQSMMKKDVNFTNLIAQTASLGHESELGLANFVGELAYVGPEVKIGNNNIINTRAIIEHECILGSHNHIAINAAIAGRCKIGDFVMIGAGATVVDRVVIGSNITIGAGAVVAHDILEPGVYVGVPARKI